jgi:hypothetical protein
MDDGDIIFAIASCSCMGGTIMVLGLLLRVEAYKFNVWCLGFRACMGAGRQGFRM